MGDPGRALPQPADARAVSMLARVACLLCMALLLFAYGVMNPRHNWDMIGYVGAACHYLGLDRQSMHRATYDDLRGALSAQRFRDFTEGGELQRAFHTDPEALAQHTHYRTRLLYVLLTLAVSPLAGSLSAATVAASALAAAVLLLLSGGLLIRQRLGLFLAFPLALAAARLGSLAGYSTPDTLAAMTAMALVCIGLCRPRLALLLLPLLPAARTDYLLLAPLFAWTLYSPERRLETAIGLGLAGLVYAALTQGFGDLGYVTIFNMSFIHLGHPYPATMPISANPADYLAAYPPGLGRFFGHGSAYVILLGTLLALRARFARTGGAGRLSLESFALAASLFVLLHFALFPAGRSRHYLIAIALALLVIFTALPRLRPGK